MHLCTQDFAAQGYRVHWLLGGDVCEPSAQATSLNLGIIPNPISIKTRSVSYPFPLPPFEGWIMPDVLLLLPLIPTQSGVLQQQLTICFVQVLRLYLKINRRYGSSR